MPGDARPGVQTESLIFERVDAPDASSEWCVFAKAGDERVGFIEFLVEERVIRTVVWIDRPNAVDRSTASQFVGVLDDTATSFPDRPVVVSVSDPLVRYEARLLGYSGALRAPLTKYPDDHTESPDPDDEGSLARDLALFLPGLAVESRRARRVQHFVITSGDIGGKFWTRIKRRPSVMAEEVAAAIDTVFAVKRRFGSVAEDVRKLQIDNDDYGTAPSRDWAGLALGKGAFAVNHDLIFADDLAAGRRSHRCGGPTTSGSAGIGSPPPALVPPPFTVTDGVTAHELWHLFDSAIMGTGTEYVEFNRVLGEALGVATLELALRGCEPGRPTAWHDAHLRLALEVSPYATTNPREATAEMFKMWWCSNGERTPTVERFGELVEARLELLRSGRC